MSARVHRVIHRKEEMIEILEVDSFTPDVVRILLSAHLPVPNQISRTQHAFFEEMLKRGSDKYTKDLLEEKLETLGAQVVCNAEDDVLTVGITARTSLLREVLVIVKDILTHPRFLESEIEKLKKEFMQELHEEEDDTRALSFGMFMRALYEESNPNYVPSIHARRKELKKITRASLRRAHSAFLTAPWVISVAANDSARVEALATLTHIHGHASTETMPPVPARTVDGVAEYHNVPGKQNIEFFMGNRLLLTTLDEDFIPFSVGLDVLGKRGGFSGRLMSTVREKEGLTYSIYAWIKGTTASAHGHWNIFTFFTPKDTERGIASTLREVRKIVTKGISPQDLTTFKVLLTNQFRLAHESTSSVLGLYHAALVGGRTPADVEAYPTRVAALSTQKVNNALRKYLYPDAIVITGAGPTSKIPHVPMTRK